MLMIVPSRRMSKMFSDVGNITPIQNRDATLAVNKGLVASGAALATSDGAEQGSTEQQLCQSTQLGIIARITSQRKVCRAT